MIKQLISFAAAMALAAPALAQEAPESAPSPGQIVSEASAEEWIGIAPEDLLVMTLAPAADGSERDVIIQLMPPPFSQGWVANIRTLARAGWYDGISVNRVQDNYVVQWGDPNYDNPEAEGEAKPLPDGLQVMTEDDFLHVRRILPGAQRWGRGPKIDQDPYAEFATFRDGFPIAGSHKKVASYRGRNHGLIWPIHCYGMIGVGRGMSPDTGSGAELYTVIGHAPRHLDRNIALVGRIIAGMEHLSSLPRGSGALGFYTDDEVDKRTPIQSIRVASDLSEAEQPRFEYLSTEGATFARYAEARANRRDPFFIQPAGGAEICNIPVPVRRVENGE